MQGSAVAPPAVRCALPGNPHSVNPFCVGDSVLRALESRLAGSAPAATAPAHSANDGHCARRCETSVICGVRRARAGFDGDSTAETRVSGVAMGRDRATCSYRELSDWNLRTESGTLPLSITAIESASSSASLRY